MFASVLGWLKGLSIIGRTAVGLTTLGVAGAVILPSISPTTPTQVKSGIVQVKTSSLVTYKTITKTQEIPFVKKTESDDSLAKDVQQIKIAGVPGTKTLSYYVTYSDGVETGRVFTKEETAVEPIDEVTSIGTYVNPAPVYVAPQPKPATQSSNCDPNYSGCVPIASDVDCAGGSGNGPAYVSGPVQVIGSDI